MDLTTAEYLWSGTLAGFLAAALVALAGILCGWFIARIWQRPSS